MLLHDYKNTRNFYLRVCRKTRKELQKQGGFPVYPLLLSYLREYQNGMVMLRKLRHTLNAGSKHRLYIQDYLRTNSKCGLSGGYTPATYMNVIMRGYNLEFTKALQEELSRLAQQGAVVTGKSARSRTAYYPKVVEEV